MGDREDGYLPIGDYGVIGDCRSLALVGVDGSIDWCSLPRFDSPSLFGRLLDRHVGGSWELAPLGRWRSWQRYSDKTNILQTVFECEGGRAQITDFMPVDGETVHAHARPHAHPRVFRVVTGLAGHVRFRHRFEPRADYGRIEFVRAEDGRLHGDAAGHHFCLTATLPLTATEQEFQVAPGTSVAFGLVANRPGQCGEGIRDLEQAQAALRATQTYWWQWLATCSYRGPYREHVERSALVLKLMTYAPTGALVAAPTTSLPEWIGGPRNWDYRYTWLRDASFSLYNLFQLGYQQEAGAFMDWVTQLTLDKEVQNLYTLDGEASQSEAELPHLEGYRGSSPVRIGNGAAEQLQLNVYGELLDTVYVYVIRGGKLSGELWGKLRDVADLAATRWQERDASIWEVRGPGQPFTYSRVMCWVAVDRALKIAKRLGLPADVERWTASRRAIHAAVLKDGWSNKLNSFSQAFGGDGLDAALLRLAQVGFLPGTDERLRATIEAVDAGLSEGPMVRRYRVEDTHDGLAGTEGAFHMCAFWLVDGLAHVGRLEEAQRRFEHLLSFSSPLGLLSEEVDPETGQLLGNFPQAFSHLSLIAAAVNMERQRHHRLGARARA
ncbi:MAG: glycoside hydrolase family 15 protein [Candidatus Dormibacteraceae bacterium]